MLPGDRRKQLSKELSFFPPKTRYLVFINDIIFTGCGWKGMFRERENNLGKMKQQLIVGFHPLTTV